MKKYFIGLLLSVLLFSISFVKANPVESELRLIGKVIYLDPGHGGTDPGAVYKDIYEKDITLAICKKLKNLLEQEGAIVYMTRYDDYDLSTSTYNRKRNDLNNRVKVINESMADIYISIHLNSVSSTTWRGAQVFYDDINENNKEIASILQLTLNKERKIKEVDDILMNRKIKIPGVLIEAGFLSNPNDRYLLKNSNYQYELCNEIKDGIIEYFTNLTT